MILYPTMDRDVDDDDCVDNDDGLRAITRQFEGMTSDERRNIFYRGWVLGFADAVRV